MGRYSTLGSASKGLTLNTRSRSRRGVNRNSGSRQVDAETPDGEGMIDVPDDETQTNTEAKNYKGLDRLKWNSELHELFVSCVNRLGGPYSAKPKDITRLMNVDGLTLNHVKSHLQKHRNASRIENYGHGLPTVDHLQIAPLVTAAGFSSHNLDQISRILQNSIARDGTGHAMIQREANRYSKDGQVKPGFGHDQLKMKSDAGFDNDSLNGGSLSIESKRPSGDSDEGSYFRLDTKDAPRLTAAGKQTTELILDRTAKPMQDAARLCISQDAKNDKSNSIPLHESLMQFNKQIQAAIEKQKTVNMILRTQLALQIQERNNLATSLSQILDDMRSVAMFETV
eukprot:jgi/Picsp_1/5088/NSC_02451-R1_two-component response regulator arr2